MKNIEKLLTIAGAGHGDSRPVTDYPVT